MPKTAKLSLKGNVQGVGLRYTVRQYAVENNLVGWIRNEPDGTVSCSLQNNQEEVNKFTKWLKDSHQLKGIDQIDEKWQEDEIDYDNFMIIY